MAGKKNDKGGGSKDKKEEKGGKAKGAQSINVRHILVRARTTPAFQPSAVTSS